MNPPRYNIRRDLSNIVEGPTGMHAVAPPIDAATLCDILQRAWDKGFKAGCDACHSVEDAGKAWEDKCRAVNVDPEALKPKARAAK